MIYMLVIACLLAGGAAGWVITYGWFHRGKIRARIAAEVKEAANKL